MQDLQLALLVDLVSSFQVPVLHNEQDPEPVLDWYFPKGQSMQSFAKLWLEAVAALSTKNVPASHSVQSED